MIENISTMEELGEWWSGGEGRMLLDEEAGPGLRHIGDVIFESPNFGRNLDETKFWVGTIQLLAPNQSNNGVYEKVMGRFGIRLTACNFVTDETTPRRHQDVIFAFLMRKDEWPLMAVREKLSA